MKKVLLSIILLVICQTISGQQLNQQTNHYRSGDMLEKKQVAVKDFCLNANNGVWSLEDADISKKSFNTEYSAKKDYYPFGGLFGESASGDTQRFKYNGKELDHMHGLDWYDYGARHMDGMRFTTIDPLAGDYYSISPYSYCANNPINAIDPDGRSTQVKALENGTYQVIGNIAAGYIAAVSGLSWGLARMGFDIYQGGIEGPSTQNAEYYGWNYGRKSIPFNKKKFNSNYPY